MNINFHEQFKNYSNTDLLKVTRQAAEYQEAAVEAASNILKERNILESDIEEVNNHYEEKETKAQKERDKINYYKEKATGIFNPVLQPGTEFTPAKWLHILLIIIALQYLWTCYSSFKRLFQFFQCYNCSFEIPTILTFLNLFYIPFIFYLLYKRKRWGWILLFSDNVISFISQLSQSYFFFKYQKLYHDDTLSFVIPIMIKAAFIVFLWRKDISALFNITGKIKKTTAIIATMIISLFLVTLQLLYN